MAEANKTTLLYYPEMEMWRSLRPVDTHVVDPKNGFTRDTAKAVPYGSYVQVPVNHDFSETFNMEKFDGKCFGKGELHNLVTCL